VTFSGAEAGSYSVGTSTGSFTQIEAVEGTAQNDTLNAAASTANQSLYGGGGADSVSGGSGNDTLDGGTGNDTLTGGAGNDSVQGGDGADRIITGAADGTDTIAGGEGPTDQDTLAFTGASAVSVTFSGAEAGSYSVGTSTGSFTQIEAVEGTAQNDTLNAAASTVNQSLYGGGGADSVSGGSGNDTLDGGTGNDTLTGGAGNDSLQGGDGADRIIVSATDGVDQIAGGEGPTDQDTLDFFGTGSATVIFTGNESGTYSLGSASGSFSQIETVEGTEQGDTLNAAATTAGQTLAGFGGDDTLTGGAGSDSLSGGTGNDTLTGGAGADVLDGGAGLDLGDYSASDAGVQIDLSTGSATGGHAQGDSLGGIDGLVGSAFDDSLTGYDADSFVPGNTFTNIFFGGAGNDSLSGRGGSDSLYGGADNDTIFGGTGNDLLDGGTGNDRLDGGAGNDSLTGNAGDDRFVLADGFGTDTVLGGETAETGGDVLDASGLTGDAVLDLSAIGPGNPEDGLLSQGSNSASFAEIEAVILGAGNDSIIGSAGADSVMAGLGADTLDGGAGNDRFDLGADSDQDLIIIEDGDGQDLILNFAAPIDNGGGNFTGRDLVDVSGLTDTNGDPVNVWDVTVSDDGSGNAVLTFPNGEALRLIGVPPAALADPRALIAMGIPGSDGTVAGTVGDDLIDAAYLGDPDGDRVDAADNLGSGGANDDLIAADAGNDTVLAGDGDDTVWAGTGNDSVLGGAGNDIILGDLGDDRLSGGSGDDYIDAGPGADTLWGDGGNDTLYAGAGSQLIFGGADDDLVSGGLDADTIQGDSGNDNLSGDQGDDLIDGGDGDDALMGGSGGDSLLGGTGADYLDGGTGNDRLDGGTGADSLLGNAGDDRFVLTNSHGDDSLSGGETAETTGDLLDASAMTDDVVLDLAAGTPGDPEDGTLTSAGGTVTFWEIEAAELGAGNDTVIGSAGSDRVDAGAGNDVMTGGAGADSLSGGTGNDRITFGQGDSINAGTGDDLLTLADHAEPGSAAITLSGGDGIDSLRLGQLADLSTLTITSSGPNGLTGTVVLDDGSLLSFTEIENIICFTPGTLIATPRGARRIEDLAPGDLVVTRDHGLQPVRWIGQRTVAAEGRFAPIRLRPGTLMGLERDLVVSPQHRMLFQGYRAQLLFGDSEVLVPALHLVDGKAVTRDEGGEVTYVHLLFDQHEVIFAEGTATESFHPGDIGLSALDGAAREELFALFPELRSSPGSYGDTARRCLKRHEALLLRV
jgi:Ca2+-binding RTX toxin-like protein